MMITAKEKRVDRKRIDAARGRREQGKRPFVSDNEILTKAGLEPNELPPLKPVPPERGTDERRVLSAICQCPNGDTVAHLALTFGMDEKKVRTAIDRLRNPGGWPIWNDNQFRFWLDENGPLTAEALRELE